LIACFSAAVRAWGNLAAVGRERGVGSTLVTNGCSGGRQPSAALSQLAMGFHLGQICAITLKPLIPTAAIANPLHHSNPARLLSCDLSRHRRAIMVT
jgi:hypothetical protein